MALHRVVIFLNVILRPLFENGFHETPFVAYDTSGFLCVFECLLALWIFSHLHSILFIGGETRKTEESYCNVVRSLMRQKISMVSASEFVNQRNPHLSVLLKLRQLIRVNYVAQVTSNHDGSISIVS